jgi:outer membrane protein TolC
LSQWWAQFDDPLLLHLIEAGQHASPSLAEAAARIAEARAARVSARAGLMPALDASADSSRGKQALGGVSPVSSTTLTTAGLQAGWELDLFGAVRAGANAARARLESSQARWHEARVSVAAEVAATYVELRACEAQSLQAARDATSRSQTSRLTSLAAKAGFQAPAAADQANAGAAQGTVLLIQQRTRCDLLIKALTALTAQDEAALRSALVSGTGQLPQPAEFLVTTIPAGVLAQRPDLYAAERDVMAASADSAEAEVAPHLAEREHRDDSPRLRGNEYNGQRLEHRTGDRHTAAVRRGNAPSQRAGRTGPLRGRQDRLFRSPA